MKKIYFIAFFVAFLLGSVGVFQFFSSPERHPASFSNAELEYAEDFFKNESEQVPFELEVYPLEKPEKKERPPSTLSDQIAENLEDKYHQKLWNSLKEQGKQPRQPLLDQQLQQRGEAFWNFHNEKARKEQLEEIRRQAREQGYKVIVDEVDGKTLYIEKL